ncbi:transposase [Longibaculum muris]|uniref:transposase n=1 Tax=Longibaculum muris TaxID=1796628 RepID=UPI003AB3797E
MKQILSILDLRHLVNPGTATEQQPVFMILSTDKENQYPRFIKLCVIPTDNKKYINRFFHMKAAIAREKTLNTDGKTTFVDLLGEIRLKSEKIIYTEEDHRLKWLNIIAGNIKNNIVGIYHGVTKQSMPLFLHEQEWRFNHRYTGKHIMEKVAKYITKSFPIDDKKLSNLLNLSKSYFSPCV